MSIVKSLSPLLAMINNPFRNLNHLLDREPFEEICKSIEFKGSSDKAQSKIFSDILALGYQIRFKLAFFLHDWETGNLQLSRQDVIRHTCGINFEINLLYWYAIQFTHRDLTILSNIDQLTKKCQERFADYLHVANALDPTLANGFIAGSYNSNVKVATLDQALQYQICPSIIYLKTDYLAGTISQLEHPEWVKWATPKTNALEIDSLTRIRHFMHLLDEALQMFESPFTVLTEADTLDLGIRLLYLITYGHENDDLGILTNIDHYARIDYDSRIDVKHIPFPTYRDSNLINNGPDIITAPMTRN